MDPKAASAAPVLLVMDYRTQKIADLPLLNVISADHFIRNTYTAREAMRWDNATTAVHFKACLPKPKNSKPLIPKAGQHCHQYLAFA